MPRPPLPVGAHGRVHRRELPDGRWMALCRVRDPDGVTRRVYRYTPPGVTDRKGAAAERALLEALTKRVTPGAAVAPDMTVAGLWDAYRAQLVDAGRSETTLRSYDSIAKRIVAGVGGLRIREATAGRLDSFVREVATRATPATARKVRVLLSGMFSLAVRYGATPANPVREVGDVPTPRKPRARSLDPADLATLLGRIRGDGDLATYCLTYDLADIVTLFAATGCRMGELLGLRWKDVDLDARTVTVAGKVVRHKGVGIVRENITKSDAGQRVVPLPAFAVDALRERAAHARLADDPDGDPDRELEGLVFAGRDDGPRNPDTVWRQWRHVRGVLGWDWVTPHTFRKTVATILDAEGLTARQAADHLGHAQVSMTQDVYYGRGRVHDAAAAAIDAALTRREN